MSSHRPADAFHLVSLGDSSGVGVGAGFDGGYPARLARRLEESGVTVYLQNLAESGATSADVVRSQLPHAATSGAALVTLGIGGNDLWRMVPVDTFAQNLQRIAADLEDALHLVVGNIIDLSQAPVAALAEGIMGIRRPQIAARIEEMNAHVAALAILPHVTVVDLHAASLKELQQHPEYFAADGFHPSAQGYERWTDLMWPAVQEVAARWQAERAAGKT